MNKLLILSLILFSFAQSSYATVYTFGNETSSALDMGGANNWARCTDYTAPTGITQVESISMYILNFGSVGTKPVMWLSSDNTVFQVFPAITSGTGWQTSTLATPVAVTAGVDYCLGFMYGDSDTDATYTNGGTGIADVTNSYATPETFGVDDTASIQISLYATGSDGAEPPPAEDNSATSTIEQTQTNLANGLFIFLGMFTFIIWFFRKRNK